MNWPHLHLLLNHAPLFGTIIATVMLAVALTRRPALARPALYLLVLSGFVAVLVYLTGEPAADALGSAAPDALVDAHEEMAGIATIVTGLAAIGATTALIASWRLPNLARWLNGTVLALGLVASGLLGWTANLGGRIQHQEARPGAPAATAPAHAGEEPGQR